MNVLNTYYNTVKTFGAFGGTSVMGVQAIARILPSPSPTVRKLRLKGFPNPIFIRPGTSDWSVLRQIFISREYDCPSKVHEQALDRFYNHALSRSEMPLIIDCGANIGLTSIWYAQAFPQAKIISIEPEPKNFAILKMNTAGYANILPMQAAISDHNGRVSLSNVGDAPWAWETTEMDSGDIKTCTIPDLLANVPRAKPMIVKIDIEGGEVSLFRSNVDWVAETPLVVFEAHDWLFHWRGTFHAIASVLAKSARDYIPSGDTIFSFSHEKLAPQ